MPATPPPDALARTYLCSRCGRTQHACTYLIEGRVGNLCDHCIRALQSHRPAGPERRGRCLLCGEVDRALRPGDVDACPDCLEVCVSILVEREQLAEASKNIEANPRDAAAWARRADLLANAGEYDRAIEDATQGIALDPALVTAYLVRSFAHCRRERWPLALADAEAGLPRAHTDDDRAVLHHNRARALVELGRAPEALVAAPFA